MNPERFKAMRRPFYGFLLVTLVAVLVVADTTRGTRRWIDIGFFQFQPSELGKVLMILVIAGFLAERSRQIAEWRTTFGAVALTAVPAVLVFMEPDFGTALVYAAILGAALFIAGTRWSQLAVLAAVGVLALALDRLVPAVDGRRRAPAVPGGAPHRLPQSGQRARQRHVQHRPVRDRGRRGRRRPGGASRTRPRRT